MDRDPLYGTRQLYAAILQTIIDDANADDQELRKELRKWLRDSDYLEVLLEWCLWANIHPGQYIKVLKKALGMRNKKR